MSRIVIALISSFAALGFATTASASTLTTGLGVRLTASDLIVPVDFKCGMVVGKLVCGSTKGNKEAALLTGLAAFFLMMNDLNQVMRGVGQTPPEDLAEQKSDPTPRSGADVYGTKHE